MPNFTEVQNYNINLKVSRKGVLFLMKTYILSNGNIPLVNGSIPW